MFTKNVDNSTKILKYRNFFKHDHWVYEIKQYDQINIRDFTELHSLKTLCPYTSNNPFLV